MHGSELPSRDECVRDAYTAVVAPYSDRQAGELDSLPLERWLLDRTSARADGMPAIEVGCGPGHVTAHLAAAGVDATGLDLTPAMIHEARRRYPDGRYVVGDLRDLTPPRNAAGWGAILAWYSLVHLTPEETPAVLQRLAGALAPGGWLVYAGHAGTDPIHADNLFGHPVSLQFHLQEPAEVAAQFGEAGLADVEWYRRGALVERRERTERAFVLGRRPPSADVSIEAQAWRPR